MARILYNHTTKEWETLPDLDVVANRERLLTYQVDFPSASYDLVADGRSFFSLTGQVLYPKWRQQAAENGVPLDIERRNSRHAVTQRVPVGDTFTFSVLVYAITPGIYRITPRHADKSVIVRVAKGTVPDVLTIPDNAIILGKLEYIARHGLDVNLANIKPEDVLRMPDYHKGIILAALLKSHQT